MALKCSCIRKRSGGHGSEPQPIQNQSDGGTERLDYEIRWKLGSQIHFGPVFGSRKLSVKSPKHGDHSPQQLGDLDYEKSFHLLTCRLDAAALWLSVGHSRLSTQLALQLHSAKAHFQIFRRSAAHASMHLVLN